ncbi:MAG TPA: hypothetical protein VLX61_11035 [Anaerolineales bacterium]|nr:hypothetical protein [Anaerolineales bacterium]
MAVSVGVRVEAAVGVGFEVSSDVAVTVAIDVDAEVEQALNRKANNTARVSNRICFMFNTSFLLSHIIKTRSIFQAF